MMRLVVGEEQVLRFNSENAAVSLGVECFNILEGFAQIALIFGEGDFSVHPFDHFLIIDLLLDGELGQFGRFALIVVGFLGISQNRHVKLYFSNLNIIV